MTHISNVIDIEKVYQQKIEHEETNSINSLSAKLVDAVFTLFFILCRGAEELYSDKTRLNAERTQWQLAFTRAGYTRREQINKALLRLERHKFPKPPQLGEFLSWNQPSAYDLGLLAKEQAYNAAYRLMRDGDIGDMSEDQFNIIQYVINESDKHFLKNNSMDKTQPVFYRNYEIAIRDFISGKMKSIAKGIENKNDKTIELKKQEEVAQKFENLIGYDQNMTTIKKMLGMKEDEDFNG